MLGFDVLVSRSLQRESPACGSLRGRSTHTKVGLQIVTIDEQIGRSYVDQVETAFCHLHSRRIINHQSHRYQSLLRYNFIDLLTFSRSSCSHRYTQPRY